MYQLFRLFSSKEEGQGLVEYALIIALIAIAIIGVFPGVRGALEGVFNSIATAVSGSGS